jgi:hypothetical protein
MEYKNIIHYGDILAIPFFFLLVIYFLVKKNKTKFEYILLLFTIGGLIADIFFSYNFLTNN